MTYEELILWHRHRAIAAKLQASQGAYDEAYKFARETYEKIAEMHLLTVIALGGNPQS